MTACGGGVRPQIVARTDAAGRRHPGQLARPGARVVDVVEHEVGDDHVEAVVGVGQVGQAGHDDVLAEPRAPASAAISGSGSTPIASCPAARAAATSAPVPQPDVEQPRAGRQAGEQRRDRARAQPREAPRIGLAPRRSTVLQPRARDPTTAPTPQPQPDRAARRRPSTGARARRTSGGADHDGPAPGLRLAQGVARRRRDARSRAGAPSRRPARGTLCTSDVVLADGEERRRLRRLVERVAAARRSSHLAVGVDPHRPRRSAAGRPRPSRRATNASIAGQLDHDVARGAARPAAYQTTGSVFASSRTSGGSAAATPTTASPAGEHGERPRADARRDRRRVDAATPRSALGPREPRVRAGRAGRRGVRRGAPARPAAAAGRRARGPRPRGSTSTCSSRTRRDHDRRLASSVSATASRASSAAHALVLEPADQVGPAGVDVAREVGPSSCRVSATASTVLRSGGRRRMGSGAERHRAVDLPLVLEQRHRGDALARPARPRSRRPTTRRRPGWRTAGRRGPRRPRPPRPRRPRAATTTAARRRRAGGRSAAARAARQDSRTDGSTNGGLTSWKISRRPRTSTPTSASSATIVGISARPMPFLQRRARTCRR